MKVLSAILSTPTKISVTHWLGIDQIYPVDIQVLFPHQVCLKVGLVVRLPSKSHHTKNREAD